MNLSWENLVVPYENNIGADQPAHLRSLISAFVVRCLDSIIPLVSIHKIMSWLASVAEQAGLSLTWSDPKDRFSRDEAEVFLYKWSRFTAVKVIWAASWQNQQNDCAPSEDSDQSGHPPSLIWVFAVRLKKAKILSYPLSAQRRLWSDWVDAQADQILCWAHMPFCWFCDEVTHLSHDTIKHTASHPVGPDLELFETS